MKRRAFKILTYIFIFVGVMVSVFLTPDYSYAQNKTENLPNLTINLDGKEVGTDGTVSSTLKLVALISIIAFAPAMMLTTTCFTRIAVILSMTRTTLGTQQAPPNMVITGLALFLTFSIMSPVFSKMYDEGISPLISGEMGVEEAMDHAIPPLKKFLVRHAREKDIALFLNITHSEVPESADDVSMLVAIPSFVLSELNTAFQIGFLIALPFLVLDMVVSSVLTSMSMITLPPTVISLPLKLMLFVIVDGWHLIISSLVETYHT